jgi:hypothetical protein
VSVGCEPGDGWTSTVGSGATRAPAGAVAAPSPRSAIRTANAKVRETVCILATSLAGEELHRELRCARPIGLATAAGE